MRNIFAPSIPVYVQLNAGDHSHNVAHGAAGFVDIDISADVPAGAVQADILAYITTAAGYVGVRPAGGAQAQDVFLASGSRFEFLVVPSATRHIEGYRDAAGDATYYVRGYWKRG